MVKDLAVRASALADNFQGPATPASYPLDVTGRSDTAETCRDGLNVLCWLQEVIKMLEYVFSVLHSIANLVIKICVILILAPLALLCFALVLAVLSRL